MNTVQSTIYGNKLLLAMLLGRTPVIDKFSTVNERLEIQANAVPVAGENIRLGILCAGNKGHRATIGVEGIPLTSLQDHYADNASLYGPRPWVIRDVNEDLTMAQRNMFCLRREEIYDGVACYEYYGLRVDVSVEDAPITMERRTMEDGVERIEPFVPNSSNLYPVPQELPNTGAVTASDVRLVASTLLSVTLNEWIIAEYINAIKIKYNGDERYAVQSEYALCTGIDRRVTVPSTSGSIEFLESVCTQVYSFANDHKALWINSQELKLDFDVGNQTPLLGTESIPTIETIGVSATNDSVISSQL